MRISVSFLLMLALLTLLPAGAAAEGDPTAKNLHFVHLECSITSVDKSDASLEACEKQIRLVDVTENGRRLRTILGNSQGNPIPLNSFHEGQRIFVRGFPQKDGSVVAREIYRLPPGKASEIFSFMNSIPDWSWEPLD